MSWTVNLVSNGECGECGQPVPRTSDLEIGDMTYNVSPMYYSSLEFAYKQLHEEEYQPQSDESGFGLRQLDGMRCVDALPYLMVATAHMKLNPDKFKAMNPVNGWGSYESALEFLENLKQGCMSNLESYIEVL